MRIWKADVESIIRDVLLAEDCPADQFAVLSENRTLWQDGQYGTAELVQGYHQRWRIRNKKPLLRWILRNPSYYVRLSESESLLFYSPCWMAYNQRDINRRRFVASIRLTNRRVLIDWGAILTGERSIHFHEIEHVGLSGFRCRGQRVSGLNFKLQRQETVYLYDFGWGGEPRKEDHRLADLCITVLDHLMQTGGKVHVEEVDWGPRSNGPSTGSSGCGQNEPARGTQSCLEVLGLPTNASLEDIRTRFKELVAKYHPDKFASLTSEFQEIATRKTREILEAYEYLMNHRV